MPVKPQPIFGRPIYRPPVMASRKQKKALESKRIQALIDGSQETKVAVFQSALININPSVTTNGAQKIMPDIAHGVNSWQRTGQKIRLTKLVVRGHYFISGLGFPANSGGEPNVNEKFRFIARRFILKDKENNNYSDVATGDLDLLLEAPGAVGQPYNGSMLSHNTPVNLGKFTKKKDEKRYLTTSWRQTSTTGANELAPTDNNVVFYEDTFEFGGKGMELLYDGSNQPINFPMFQGIGFCTINNLAPNATVQMQYVATAYYKD